MKIKAKQAKPSFIPSNRQQAQRKESIITRMCGIVIDDIKHLFHADAKSRENKMRYEEFMGMFKR